jgi:hypothetical protein
LIKDSVGEFPTTSQIAQLSNEYVINRQLADVPGVRFFSPTQDFFDKTWKPDNIEKAGSKQ